MTTNDPVGAARSGAVEDPRDSIEDWLQEMSGIDHAPELRSGLAVPPPPAPGESPFDDPELEGSPFDRLDFDRPGVERPGFEQPGFEQSGLDDRSPFERRATAEQPAFPPEQPEYTRPRHGYDVEPDDEPTGSWAFEVPRQSTGGGGGGGRHRAED